MQKDCKSLLYFMESITTNMTLSSPPFDGFQMELIISSYRKFEGCVLAAQSKIHFNSNSAKGSKDSFKADRALRLFLVEGSLIIEHKVGYFDFSFGAIVSICGQGRLMLLKLDRKSSDLSRKRPYSKVAILIRTFSRITSLRYSSSLG